MSGSVKNRSRVGRSALAPVLGTCLALVTAGCFTSTPRLNSVADALEEDLAGTTFERDFGLKLGRISTGFAKGIAGLALDGDEEEDRAIHDSMKGVHRIEIATYQTHGDLLIDGPLAFERTMEHRGWQTVARLREDDSFTWVVFEERKGHLRGFMVVALENDELTLVQLRGRLDRTLAAAMQIAKDETGNAGWESPDTEVAVEEEPSSHPLSRETLAARSPHTSALPTSRGGSQ